MHKSRCSSRASRASNFTDGHIDSVDIAFSKLASGFLIVQYKVIGSILIHCFLERACYGSRLHVPSCSSARYLSYNTFFMLQETLYIIRRSFARTVYWLTAASTPFPPIQRLSIIAPRRIISLGYCIQYSHVTPADISVEHAGFNILSVC